MPKKSVPTMSTRCKHGIPTEWCTVCQEPVPEPEPQPGHQPNRPRKWSRHRPNDPSPTSIIQASKPRHKPVSEVPEHQRGLSYAVIKTTKGRRHNSFHSLGPATKFVHIDGHPYLWAIRKILDRAQFLKVIEVTPKTEHALNASHLAACSDRNVTVQAGYHCSDLAWQGTRSPVYDKQRRYLLDLDGQAKERWDEILEMGFRAATMTARYFCLDGEDFLPQREIAALFGYKAQASVVSRYIGAVLHFLDPSFETGNESMATATAMKNKTRRLRALLHGEQERAQLAAEIGIPHFPPNLPISRFELYQELVRAKNDGTLARLARTDPRSVWAIDRRYGLDDLADPTFRTLQEVGDEVDLTRERIRQLTTRGIKTLNLLED